MINHDMVVSYYIQKEPSLFRQLTAWGARLLLFFLFGPIPRYQGIYMFKRELLDKIQLKMHTSFVYNYEIVIRAKKQGFKIKEVPTRCLPRQSGHSKVLGVGKIFFIFREIIKFRLYF